MKNFCLQVVIFASVCILVSCAENDSKANPYSQYVEGQAPYSQYSEADKLQFSHVNTCEDLNWDSECLCARQEQKISWVKSHGKSLNQFDWSKIQSKQLVIVGDEHGMSNPSSILNLIKQSRSKTGTQCMLFEMSSDFSGDQYVNLLKERTGEPATDLLRAYYGQIANGAMALGFKLHMVDDPKNWDGESYVTDLEREAHMAATIKELFKTQKCDHAVLVVGKAHVATHYYQKDNLPEALLKSGISLSRLNPIQAPNGGRTALEGWNGICLAQSFTPPEALIFENSGIKDDLIIPGFSEPMTVMKFGSFDYSILFPESNFKQK